jgi:hypothetical protein
MPLQIGLEEWRTSKAAQIVHQLAPRKRWQKVFAGEVIPSAASFPAQKGISHATATEGTVQIESQWTARRRE